MKEQKILIEDHAYQLKEKVDELSKLGWKVVPSTTYITSVPYVVGLDNMQRRTPGRHRL